MLRTTSIGILAFVAACSKGGKDPAAAEKDQQQEAQKHKDADEAVATVRVLDKRLQVAYSAIQAAKNPAKCTTPPPGTVPVIDLDLLKSLATREPPIRLRSEYGGRERDDSIDDFLKLSSPVFVALRDDHEADLVFERTKARSTYDEIQDGPYSFDHTKRVSTMAAAAKIALTHKHLLVMDYTTKEVPKISSGGNIGILTPGKLAGRVIVVDLEAARVDCATPIRSTNTDGVEKNGESSVDLDFFHNAHVSIHKALGIPADRMITPTLWGEPAP